MKKSEELLSELQDKASEASKSLDFISGRDNPAYSLTRDQFVNELRISLDDYGDISLTEKEVQVLGDKLRKMAHGSINAGILTCTGKMCPFRHKCYLYEIDRAPVGFACLIESNLVHNWIIRYLDDYAVDPSNMSEVNMITELVELELYDYRINLLQSNPDNASLVTLQIVNVTKEGNPIRDLKPSPYWEVKQWIKTRKSRLMNLMEGTRQAKTKRDAALKTRSEADPSTINTDTRKKLEKLIQTSTLQELPKE